MTTFPDRVGPFPKKKPTEYIRGGQLYFDSIMFTGEGMRHLIAEAGIDQIVLGTDYPFPWNTAPVDHIMAIPDLSDADRIKILGATAAKLLGIKV
jgi:aminocarboxymuconate-semialdehyde decarboxylase